MYERNKITKEGGAKACYGVSHTSSLLLSFLTPSRPVMSTGCGFSSSYNYSQFTPNPVRTAATTSTVTITTSLASMSAPQGGRINSLGTGPTTMYPATMPGQPFNFSQHDWPRLPSTMGLYSTMVSSITTTPAQGATSRVESVPPYMIL